MSTRNTFEAKGESPTPAVPDGYLEDAIGRLNPIDRIDPIDLQRNELVNDLASAAEAHSARTADLKRRLRDDIAAHISLVADEYGVSLGGQRGNVSLTNYNGTRRVTRTLAARLGIGEQILAAEQIVRNLLDKWTETSGPELRALVDRAFDRNEKGKMSVSRLIDLSRAKIEGKEWEAAVQAINDALLMDGEVTYYRVYRRDNALDDWQQIPLDMTSVVLTAGG